MPRRTADRVVGFQFYEDGLSPQPTGFHLVSIQLVDALARWGNSRLVMASPQLLAPAGSRPAVGPSLRRLQRKHGDKIGLTGFALDRETWPSAAVWHGIHGTLKELLQWRELGVTAGAPITAMQHGFLDARAIFDLLLYDVRPSDTFICSSNGSKSVMLDTIEHLSGRLGLDVSKRLPLRLDVVPYGVDVETFRPRADRSKLRRQLGLPEQSLIVLVLGRISPAWKGDVLPLLGAFKNVAGSLPRGRVSLVLAGYFRDDESYETVVRHYIGELGLADSVILLGNVPPQRRHLLLASADVSVSISDFLNENFGLVPLEAMACGVPQIVSSWDGYRETVVDGVTGFCVRTAWAKWDGDLGGTWPFLGNVGSWVAGQTVALDTVQLEARLRTLLESASLRESMSRESRLRAEREYAWRAIVPRFEAVWSEAIARARRERRARRPFVPLSVYDQFKRQASETLDDEAVVQLGSWGAAALAGRFSIPIYGELELFLSGDVAADMLEVARRRKRLRVGALTRHAQRAGLPRDRARRHVLFLLKHGLLVRSRAHS